MCALGAGEHAALDGARLQAHGTDVVTGVVALPAQGRASGVETDHHRAVVGHPRQALEQPDRTAETAEQVSRQQKFDAQCDAGGTDEQSLAQRQLAVHQVAIHLGGRQQIGQQHNRPQQRKAEHRQQCRQPVPGIRHLARTVGLDLWQRSTLPDTGPATGAAHQSVDHLDHREMRTQPTAVQAAITPGDPQEQGSPAKQRQEAAPEQVERGPERAADAADECVDTKGPVHTQQDCVPAVQVDTQDVERRRQYEQQKKADLERQTATLQTTAPHARVTASRTRSAADGQPMENASTVRTSPSPDRRPRTSPASSETG